LIAGLIILFPPLLWQLSAIYIVKMETDRGVGESFRRTKDVLKDNFWWTWLIVVCAWIAILIIAFIFMMPQAAYQMILMFTNIRTGVSSEPSIAFMIVATICTFFGTLIYSGLFVINAIHYFSLAEKKDGMGLMERINEIGQTPKNNVEEQY
jgi:hypothetical protein